MMKKSKQRGFTLVELLITSAIATIIAIASAPALVAKIEDAGMEGTGVYMAMVKIGLERYNLTNHDSLVAGTAQAVVIPAVADAYAPTIAELVRDKYITGSSLTAITPQRQSILTRITTPNCPGATCAVVGLAYTTTALVYSGTTDPRFDLLGTYLASPGVAGGGLITKPEGDGSILSGNSGMAFPNPMGAVPGVFAIYTYVDQSLYANFVRIQDTRDADLRGGLTLSGMSKDGVNTLRVNGDAITTGNSAINGSQTVAGPATFLNDVSVKDPGAGTVCVKFYVAGQIDVNCNGVLNAKAGTFTGPLGTVRVGNTGSAYTIDSSGKVRGQNGFYTAVNSMFGDNPNGVMFGGTFFTVTQDGINALLSVQSDGQVQARKSVATQFIALTSAVTLGQACGTPATMSVQGPATMPGNTALASDGNGGVATCIGGVWTGITKLGAFNAACPTEGAMAADAAGIALICQGGRYASLADRFGSLVFSESTVVSNVGINPLATDQPAYPAVSKPLCASTSAPPRAYIIPNNETQRPQKVNRYLQDNGSSWLVYMLDGNRNVVTDASATVQTYCAYN
ncbi:hypothetical protein BH10PSE16_BH10PSE16_04000 [soil metagenome]